MKKRTSEMLILAAMLVYRSLISIAIYTFHGIIGETLIRSQSCHLKEREVICYSERRKRAA